MNRLKQRLFKIIHSVDSVQRLICILLLGGIAIQVNAQHDYIETASYSINDGLSDRSVTSISQSSDGLLWLATTSGLNKFDGYEFTIFNDHPNNSNQISDANIEHIKEVHNRKLFIQYKNNLVYFDLLDLDSYELHKIELLPRNGIKGIVRYLSINYQQEIQVLSQTDSAYHFYNLKDLSFEPLFTIPFKHKKKSIYAKFLQLSNGQFLLHDNVKGLRMISETGKIIKHFTVKDFDSDYYPSAYPSRMNFIHEAKDSSIWLAFSKIPCVFKLDASLQKLNQFLPLASRRIFRRIWEDATGNLLVEQSYWKGRNSSAIGLYCIKEDRTTEDFKFLLKESKNIGDIFSKDFTKELIIGQSSGLRILQNNQAKIKTFLARKEYNKRGAFIRGITSTPRKDAYFTSDNGVIYQIDLTNDHLTPVYVVDEKTGNTKSFYCPYNLHYDPDSNWLWTVSCDNAAQGSLNRIDLSTCTSVSYPYSGTFYGFVKSTDGKFWLIAQNSDNQGSLIIFDPSTSKFQPFEDNDHNNPLKNTNPRYIEETKNNQLLVGTDNGLVAINREGNTCYTYDKDNSELTSNYIYIIHEDKKGRIWLGTTNGFNIFDPLNGTVETYDKSHGLASNTVCGILESDNDQFWISTYYGLSHFDYKEKLFHNFYQLDGLSHDEFNRFSFHRDLDGRFFFGGVDGVNSFYPEVLLEKKDAPKIALTKLVKYNSNTNEPEIITKNLANLEKVDISPFDTYFQFYFTFPDYTYSINNQYSAWLEGFDNDWIYLGNTPTVRYNKLPAGNYTLHINGSGPNGNWSDQFLSLRINVKPLFYKTWWFILILSVISAASLFGFFQYQLDQKMKVQELRVKLSSDLHDEMSGLLSGIAMQSDILQMMAADEESKSRLKIIGQVSRKAMSKMSDVIWSIDSRKDKVQDLVQRMYEHADEMLLPLNIQYNLKIKKVDEQQKMPVNIRQNLYFIFKEAINNVAKHSNATLVDISLGNSGSHFEMLVRDNGTDILSKPISKNGQGLSNLKMRADRINADLKIEKSKGFSILLKMRKL